MNLERKTTSPRLGLLETDIWVESAQDGRLESWPRFPMRRLPKGLLAGEDFTPDIYLAEIERLSQGQPGRCDVLMYYGGRRQPGVEAHGLNFNAWNPAQLRRLHALGGRPFIGLETFDPAVVAGMVDALAAGGFNGSQLFVRIASEPSSTFYGTLDMTLHGLRRTRSCYNAYRKRFLRTASLIRIMGHRAGIQFQIVFAGDSAEDFDRYLPDPSKLDAIGFDLYVTPANIHTKMTLLRRILTKFRDKPIVIPEFGIATAGESGDTGKLGIRATPSWGQAALGDVLSRLGRHPGGVKQVTLFSVDVSGRLESRRWSWAWTPAMFDLLEEWQRAPSRWNPYGFHRYNPRSYPLNRDVLYRSGPGYRVVYRKISEASAGRPATFLQTAYRFRAGYWERFQREVVIAK